MIAAIYVLGFSISLAIATFAEAECAWVLWEKRSYEGSVGTWQIARAFDSLSSCTKEQNSLLSAHGKVVPGQSMSIGGGSALSLACLPDTIDPREPKGGGR